MSSLWNRSESCHVETARMAISINAPRSPVHGIYDAKAALLDQPSEVTREPPPFQLAILIDDVLFTIIEVRRQNTHSLPCPTFPPLRQCLIKYFAACLIEWIAVRRRSKNPRETVVEPV